MNISIAMTVRSIAPGYGSCVRAGDGRVANDTRSLFRVGLVRDVHRIAPALIAARDRVDARRATLPRRRSGSALGDQLGRHRLEHLDVRVDGASSWVTDSVHSSSRPGVMKMPRFMLHSHARSASSASWFALNVS